MECLTLRWTKLVRLGCEIVKPRVAPRAQPHFDLAMIGQEVEDVVAEVAAVAGILGLSDRITQELVSLQPRRALAKPVTPVGAHKPPCQGFSCRPLGWPPGGSRLLRMHLCISWRNTCETMMYF